jgi:hypothetical protein
MSTSDFSPGHRALPRIFANPKESQLAEITQLLFQSGSKIFVEARQEINEYPGEAVSYEAMQHCVEIGAGAALLPRSKVADGFRSKARVLHADNGDIIRMDVIATWNAVQEPTGPLASLLSYLVTLDTPGSGLFVAPGGVTQAG